MYKRAGLRRRRINEQGRRARGERALDPIDARVEHVLEEHGALGLSCPICRRGELMAQVASENPHWARERVERFVDGLLAPPKLRAG